MAPKWAVEVLSQRRHPFSGRSDSRVSLVCCYETTSRLHFTAATVAVKKKREFFPGRAPADPSFLSLPITKQSLALLVKITGCRNMNLLPFRGLLCPPHACACRKTTSLRQNKHNTQDRLTLGQALFPRNLSPRQSSTIPVESLLLPPRSAPCALPAALTGAPLPATHAPSYMLGPFIRPNSRV